jgi:DNA-directed RNA polymerase subunit RPC12/RpoP
MRSRKPTAAKIGAHIGKTRIAAARESAKATEHAALAARLACEEFNLRMIGFGGPPKPSPTVGQAIGAGYVWLEIRCRRCSTHALLHLGAVNDARRSPDLAVWEVEDSLRCRHCSYERRLPPPRGVRRWKPPAALVRLRKARSLDFEPWYPEEEPRPPPRRKAVRSR